MSVDNIVLNRKLSSTGSEALHQAYYTVMTATYETSGDPANIFVMNPANTPLDGALGRTEPAFINVTNPIDYYELGTDTSKSSYLSNTITLQYTNTDVMDEDWLKIQDDVDGLLLALRSEEVPLDDSLEEEVVIG